MDGAPSNDALFTIHLEARPQLQPRNAARVNADQMKPIRWDIDGELLRGTSVTAREQRCLAAFFGQQICRRDRERAIRIKRGGRDRGY